MHYLYKLSILVLYTFNNEENMADFKMVRIRNQTNRKLEKLQAQINRVELTHKNKGEIIDIALTARLEESK